jgi:hypothetical protein
MSSPMGDTYGLDDAKLGQIYSGTFQSLQRMDQLNTGIGNHSDSMKQANQSDSGNIMHERFSTWSSDFHKIRANLQYLNDKVKAIKDAGGGASDDTTAVAAKK